MQIVISHPSSNMVNRAAVEGIYKAGLLAEFNTAVATFPGDLLDRASTIPFLAEIQRRRFNPDLRAATRTWPWRELGRLLVGKIGLPSLARHETGFFSLDAVYHSLDRRVAARLPYTIRQGANAVFAYEDGAAFSFEAAKKLGLQCFYDLPIGYWRTAQRLLAVERERWPEWAPTLTGLIDSAAKLERKDEELRLADRIFVASQFTANTLYDFPGALGPVEVIPYGFPAVGATRTYDSTVGSRPLKLLFVGGLSQRKGIANLFAAVAAIGPRVELTVVGHKASNNCPALDQALRQHRWLPSLPHTAVLQLMREHDALVFPSLFEGFGLVITEAMSQGTPVITTDRTAGPELIQHGHNGWLVEAGSTPALQAAIENLLINPHTIAENGRAAQESARHRPWSVYSHELADALQKHVPSLS